VESSVTERGPLGALFVQMRDEYGDKAARYLAVTVVNVVTGQGLLVLCSGVVGLAYVPSNVIAVSVSAVPAFILYRRWVWGLSGKSHLRTEVLPFWGIALVGLILSSGAVWVADQYSDRTIVLNLTNLAAFGVLWVLKFFFLDKLLFKVAEELVPEEPGEVERTG
jgi:putative flippase GtrA